MWRIPAKAVIILLSCGTLVMAIRATAGETDDKITLLGTKSSGSAADLPGGASPGSISLWFARRSGAADQVLFAYGSQEMGRARGLWLVKEDKLCFYFWGCPDDLHATVPGGIQPNRWHHVAATETSGTWTAKLPLGATDKPLWVYANVLYPLEVPVTLPYPV